MERVKNPFPDVGQNRDQTLHSLRNALFLEAKFSMMPSFDIEGPIGR